jgi:hypothetical protein
MTLPVIAKTEWPYFQKILQYHGLEYYPTSDMPDRSSGNQQKIHGFDQYNNLLDINLCFSTRPANDVKDRTGMTKMPYSIYYRPWSMPEKEPDSFEQCLVDRVHEICQLGQKINLLWSGGIDSTAMVVAFLKTTECHSQLRILHSVTSRKENPFFFLLLEQYPTVDVFEIGGDFYMNQILDGVFVTAASGDELLASIDQSFWNNLAGDRCNMPWRDYFLRQTSVDFVNRCEEFFQRSQRPIDTVIEARWWFYLICKFNHAFRHNIMQDPSEKMLSFFDAKIFEDYMYFNTHKIIPNNNYNSYKQFIKDYIFEFDRNKFYQQHKCKENSGQLMLYTRKKDILKNQQAIMWLSDGTRISVDTLPFLNESIYRNKYGHSLDYLFTVA